jgi:hypothetical protein
MGRQKLINDLKVAIKDNLQRAEEHSSAANAAYLVAYASFQMGLVIEQKIDDISDRLQLVETALGLIASGQKKDQ